MATQQQIEEWYRHEVITNSKEYPNLFAEIQRQNKYKFEQERD